ncbi:MAG TPA: methylated-DNA--[protein]-cysteine S-methyltransferase [Actinomycetota bacterium]|nr:methylated-DNA--[protein]-cysteine S-methyltransferase [Actinomycetota bacterium]
MRTVQGALASGREQTRDAGREAARRFVEHADRAGLVDVAYSVLDSPIGPLVGATTERGVVALSFGTESLDAVLQEVSAGVSPRVLEVPSRLDPIRRQLDEYFEGRRRRFELSVDLRLVRGFRRKVLDATARIPYGMVASYREVATRAGNPGASRAAGTALALNPVPIIVPCHRVLRTGGNLGGYGGGLERKRFLLDLEASGRDGETSPV